MTVTGILGPEADLEQISRRGRRVRDFLGRALRRKDGVAGVAILAVFGVLALAPSLFVGQLETVVSATGKALEPPSLQHLFGTDESGRDMLNLTVHGARISMAIGLMATLITIVIGALVGILSGFIGGVIDKVLLRVSDFFLVLPPIVLPLILAPIILHIIRPQAGVFRVRAALLL